MQSLPWIYMLSCLVPCFFIHMNSEDSQPWLNLTQPNSARPSAAIQVTVAGEKRSRDTLICFMLNAWLRISCGLLMILVHSHSPHPRWLVNILPFPPEIITTSFLHFLSFNDLAFYFLCEVRIIKKNIPVIIVAGTLTWADMSNLHLLWVLPANCVLLCSSPEICPWTQKLSFA